MNKEKQKLRSRQLTIKRRIYKKWSNPHCEYCGNDNLKILQLHHIKPIAQGGNNDMSNIIFLCPNCHKMVHSGQIKTDELLNLKANPKTFLNFEKLQTKLERLKLENEKLEKELRDREKGLEYLNSQWWSIQNKIITNEKYLNENKTKFQLCKYIDRVEYKYNQLKEENKQILKEKDLLIKQNNELKTQLKKITKPTFKEKIISLFFD